MKVRLLGNPLGFPLLRLLVSASRERIVVRAAPSEQTWTFDNEGMPLACPFKWARITPEEVKAIHAHVREEGRAVA